PHDRISAVALILIKSLHLHQHYELEARTMGAMIIGEKKRRIKKMIELGSNLCLRSILSEQAHLIISVPSRKHCMREPLAR
ncbi:unnamed protein product, partial [Dovyalis caffra]